MLYMEHGICNCRTTKLSNKALTLLFFQVYCTFLGHVKKPKRSVFTNCYLMHSVVEDPDRLALKYYTVLCNIFFVTGCIS